MALKITCPNCGPRPFVEFWFSGELQPHEPHEPHAAEEARETDEADFARVWLRTNACGVQRERWFHHAGCRRWHTATRNTLTNELHHASE